MTIALGFKCYDGIVLCTDTQLSKGNFLKYRGSKIFQISPQQQWVGDEWAVITAYSGFELISSRVQGIMSGRLQLVTKTVDMADRIQAVIEGVLRDEYKEHKKDLNELHMLYAISIRGEQPVLLRSFGKVVSPADFECAGQDSSVVRFLAELLCPNPQFISSNHALMIAIYMVLQAKKYSGYCGHATNAVVIKDGTVRPIFGKVLDHREKYLEKIESGVGEIMRSLADTNSIQGEREIALTRFSEEMKKLGQFTEI